MRAPPGSAREGRRGQVDDDVRRRAAVERDLVAALADGEHGKQSVRSNAARIIEK